MADPKRIDGVDFIPDTPPNMPFMRRWTVDGTPLDVYIQPGGCLEIGEVDDVKSDGVTPHREFVHFCDQKTMDAILKLWRKEVPHHG